MERLVKEELVKNLIDRFDSSTLTELHWKESDFDFRLSKIQVKSAQNAEEKTAKIQETFKEESVQEIKEGSEVSTENLTEITSPLVGLTYLQAGPDSPNFKKVGDRVEVGDVVCIVEAMKVMNEIKSEISGVITEVCVKNEEIVAYNQPLFRVKEG